MTHRTAAELEAGLPEIANSPKDCGVLRMIVRRPDIEKRELLQFAELNPVEGVAGDNWRFRGSSRTADGSPHPDMQINVMNSRAIDLIAQEESRWALAGDQLYIDFDLSEENIPPGTRLSIGFAVIEVTDQPHRGCAKFVERFGLEAMKFVNSPVGMKYHLRGINAKVVHAGTIHVGDLVRKM